MTTAAWLDLEPALSALYKRVATVPGSVPSVSGSSGPSAVGAKGMQMQFPAPTNPVTLEWSIESVHGVGKSELRSEYVPGTFDYTTGPTGPLAIEGDTFVPDPENPELRLGGVVYSQLTHTAWTIEIRIESPNPHTKPASAHARALVARMRLPSVADELEAIGLAYTGWDEIADDMYDGEDGRAISVYILRQSFNGSEYGEDSPVTTIELVNVSTNVVP